MTHNASGRFNNSLGKKMAKFINYRKARKLCNDINRGMVLFESRYLKSRLHHA